MHCLALACSEGASDRRPQCYPTPMAQHKVVDLVIQRGSVQIVHRTPTTPARTYPGEAPAWLMRSPGSWRGLVTVGAASTGAGLMLSAMSVVGGRMLTIWFANSLLSAGLCLLLLGVIKKVMTQAAPPANPTPEPIDPKLLGERSRRVRAILSKATAASELFTFERLVKESRWTQAAMLSTLLHMKERGEIVEDLNLDTGEWVYSLSDDSSMTGMTGTVAGGPGSLMLEERTAQASPPERQG